jgi:hypothetical protein
VKILSNSEEEVEEDYCSADIFQILYHQIKTNISVLEERIADSKDQLNMLDIIRQIDNIDDQTVMLERFCYDPMLDDEANLNLFCNLGRKTINKALKDRRNIIKNYDENAN